VTPQNAFSLGKASLPDSITKGLRLALDPTKDLHYRNALNTPRYYTMKYESYLQNASPQNFKPISLLYKVNTSLVTRKWQVSVL